MDDVARLLAIEEIRQLKAKYFLGVDTHDWELLRREVFCPQSTFELPEFGGVRFAGGDAIVDFFRDSLDTKVSVHHGHMPVIEITSESTATGLWAMEDRVIGSPGDLVGDALWLHGFGHYREHYVKTAAGWRIGRFCLTRLRVETARLY